MIINSLKIKIKIIRLCFWKTFITWWQKKSSLTCTKDFFGEKNAPKLSDFEELFFVNLPYLENMSPTIIYLFIYSSYNLRICWTYSLNTVTLDYLCHNMMTWAQFFPNKKLLCTFCTFLLFLVRLRENSAPKNITLVTNI